jgi:hypothetical protein
VLEWNELYASVSQKLKFFRIAKDAMRENEPPSRRWP